MTVCSHNLGCYDKIQRCYETTISGPQIIILSVLGVSTEVRNVIFKYCGIRDCPLGHLFRHNSERDCKADTDREKAKLTVLHQNNCVIPLVSVAG